MGEVKIYKAKVREIDDPVLVTPFLHFSGETHYRIIGVNNSTVTARFVSDLTELELHEAGTGVWIEGVSAEELLDLLAKSQPDTQAEPVLTTEYKVEREKHIKASCRQNHTGTNGICGICWELVKKLREGGNV